MAEILPEKPYYFLHTLVGATDRSFGKIMDANDRDWPVSPYKIDVFLEAEPESAEGIASTLGLDVREVMTTVSKKSPASTYHKSYGLVLEGEVVACFENDTGRVLQDDGTYNEHVFDFTRPSSPDELLEDWYEDFTNRKGFTWNEAILAKGSEVVGAFYDLRHRPGRQETMAGRTEADEYEMFLSKVQRCGLNVLEVTSKFGVEE